MIIGLSSSDHCLAAGEVRLLVQEALASLPLEDKRVLVIIPDGTRTMPMPLMFSLFDEFLGKRALVLDYLVALGTHPPMTDVQLSQMVGRAVQNGMVGRSRIYNHQWDDPSALSLLGSIPAQEIGTLSGGLLAQPVPVRLNKLILNYDQLIICGPVFPHEVVGFSGGNKYFFPGIAGPEIINFTHWLGALITSYKVIGSGYTPIRAVIDRAASFIQVPAACFSLVVTHAGVEGIFFGSAVESWQAAADLSAKKHIIYVEKPFRQVLSVMPVMYDDLWTAAKGMYKLEPAIADGGEVIIYAPHLDEVSYTHGALIDQVGYHCRDYFVKQWNKFKHIPGGVLAHSTHLKGMGEYDVASGTETPRINVTLATGIPESRCRLINLGYLDPASVVLTQWENREAEGILLVPRAGEMLYRIKERRNEI
jgi:lactate racemase